MAYATQQDMIDRFGESELIEVTDDENPQFGTVNSVVITKALNDASSTIDGYLAAALYKVPAVPAPDRLTLLACDIARYLLHTKEKPDAVQKGYDDAIKQLRDIAASKMKLSISLVSSDVTGDVSVAALPMTFTPDALEDY